ncbi:MAG: glutamate--cysteine ligase [Proteobacteria bacterium]|nr:glutamate--cysteine ligase [Pseudomonadota bacterium]
MGIRIDKEHFDRADHARFARRLEENLAALRLLLARPGFGDGPTTLGAELEVSVVDAAMNPCQLDRRVLAEHPDPQVQLELDRFNLEYNMPPIQASGAPFSKLRTQTQAALDSLDRMVSSQGGHAVPIGILPTLQESDLTSSALTDLPRYRALSAAIRGLRQAPFEVCISGAQPLTIRCDDVTLEGAATSFQLHLRVAPRDYARAYNAAQLATPLALVVAANSPLFLGHRLWEETRIALFKQAVDSREHASSDWRPPARVSFGHGWVRDGAYELFAETAALFPTLLPISTGQNALELAHGGSLPDLAELRLHQSTVWRWNRAIYDPSAGGHLRIELRALPSGPTPIDMAANAAFTLGLTMGLAAQLDWMLHALPFEYAHYNFYRAAQFGLRAQLLWPTRAEPSPRVCDARELALSLLPTAEEGLHALGVDEDEARVMLAVVRARLETGITAARWQMRMLQRLEAQLGPREALAALVQRYLTEASTGKAVHEWSHAP